MKIKFLLLFALFFNLPLHAQHWQPFEIDDLPPTYLVFSISVVDENVVWGACYDGTVPTNPIPPNHLPKVIKTTDGGTTWQVFDVAGASGRISYDIVAFDEDTAFITTQDLGSGPGRGLFKTTDGGLTWTEVYHHTSAGVWVRFFDEMEGVLINRNLIAKTYDGGQSWTVLDQSVIPAFGAQEFTVIVNGNNGCIQKGNHIWFNTNKGRVYHSADRGETWSAVSAGHGSDAWMVALTFRDTLHGVAMRKNTNGFPSRLSFTEDGGVTWTLSSSFMPSDYSVVSYVPGTQSSLYAAGNQILPHAFSNDYGDSWEQTQDDPRLGALVFLSPTVGWATRAGSTGSSGLAPIFKWNEDSPLFVSTVEPTRPVAMSIFPNPFSSHIQISLEQGLTPLSLEVQSIDGKLTRQIPLDQFPSIDLSSLPAGAYLLRATTDKGIAVRMVVKS